MNRLLEPQIKTLLINKLLASGKLKPSDIIVNEFTIDNASRRVDLAIISNNHLEAFEIKSEADSLTRLEGQTSKYLEYFDKVTVISAEKHSKSIEANLSKDIGLWKVTSKKFTIIQRGRKKRITQKSKILDLMTVVELKKLAKNLGLKPANYRRKTLELLLLDAPVFLLKSFALEAIKLRYNPRYSVFSKKTTGRNITEKDLSLLSTGKGKEKSKSKDEPSIENIIKSIDLINL